MVELRPVLPCESPNASLQQGIINKPGASKIVDVRGGSCTVVLQSGNLSEANGPLLALVPALGSRTNVGRGRAASAVARADGRAGSTVRVLDPALTPSQRRRVCGVTCLALSRHPVSNEVRRDARRLRPWWVGTKA